MLQKRFVGLHVRYPVGTSCFPFFFFFEGGGGGVEGGRGSSIRYDDTLIVRS